MHFTLTYRGPIRSTQRKVRESKTRLRDNFHPQIKSQLVGRLGRTGEEDLTTVVDGHAFVSPAHPFYRTAIELDVLLLVPPAIRRVGDIDNRLKTVIDGLTRPTPGQMRDFEPPSTGPTYCLMDDDSLVKRLGVDSRRWHDPEASEHDALAIVTAKVVLGDAADMTSPTGSMFLVL